MSSQSESGEKSFDESAATQPRPRATAPLSSSSSSILRRGADETSTARGVIPSDRSSVDEEAKQPKRSKYNSKFKTVGV